ncbi:MAG: hypothetical protein H7331_01925 [Bacteroidia bacterium]|nr:hypothetical protein [Bacteroidia bacterium]
MVDAVYSQLINTSADGYKCEDYNKFTPILIEAIKEQQVQQLIAKHNQEMLILLKHIKALEKIANYKIANFSFSNRVEQRKIK